jgi:hypothetical protein
MKDKRQLFLFVFIRVTCPELVEGFVGNNTRLNCYTYVSMMGLYFLGSSKPAIQAVA